MLRHAQTHELFPAQSVLNQRAFLPATWQQENKWNDDLIN